MELNDLEPGDEDNETLPDGADLDAVLASAQATPEAELEQRGQGATATIVRLDFAGGAYLFQLANDEAAAQVAAIVQAMAPPAPST